MNFRFHASLVWDGRIPLCQQQPYRRLYNRVPSFHDILARNGYRGVGIDSELRVLFVHIQDRTSRETDTPPIRQFRTERQAAATSRTVTHDRDLRKETHHIDKIVRSAVGMPVGQDDDRAQPTSAVRRGKIDRIGLGKIVMPVSFLILRVTRQNPFLKETRGDAVGIEHGTAPIVAHIEYQSFAFLEMRKHIIEVVFTHAT